MELWSRAWKGQCRDSKSNKLFRGGPCRCQAKFRPADPLGEAFHADQHQLIALDPAVSCAELIRRRKTTAITQSFQDLLQLFKRWLRSDRDQQRNRTITAEIANGLQQSIEVQTGLGEAAAAKHQDATAALQAPWDGGHD